MQYCVLTHLVSDETGRQVSKSVVLCLDKQEAVAMAELFNHPSGQSGKKMQRRATVCVTGYSEAGKYLLPLHDLNYIKSQVHSD